MKYGSFGVPPGRRFSGFKPLAGPLIITICSVLAGVAGDAGRRALRLDRDAVLGGELWRLATGHLVHLGLGHLLMNLAGLGVIVFVLRPAAVALQWWCGVALTSAAAIDAGLLWLRPDLAWYVGLSGVLHGFWAAAGLELLFGRERLYGGAITTLLIAKLVTEQLDGATEISVAIAGGPVVTDAHVLGALGGALAAVVSLVAGRRYAQASGSSL